MDEKYILIVDDVMINRVILSRFAEDYGAVLEAENGAEALDLIESNRGRIAAMLLDMVMPVLDGEGLLAALRERGCLSDFPIILVTGENTAALRARLPELGAADLLPKPFDPRAVKESLARLL